MARRPPFLPMAIVFFIFALAFSVVLWPDVPTVAKVAFFATGVGCGVGIGRSVG